MNSLLIPKNTRKKAAAGPDKGGDERMYAIAFDMDTEALEQAYPGPSWRNAYAEIQNILSEHGFTRQQGSVYFGDLRAVNAVTCVLAVMDLTRRLAWFSSSVKDIRMLRIEEQNDLLPAVHQARLPAGPEA